MAPVQLKLRKAMGAVKDQTSIQIAKVAGSPDLDVALVKATSHEESPTEEKYIFELIHYVNYSRGYTNSCIAGLSKRLNKTHNWIVALKCLMVIHRMVRDADPIFEQELNKAGTYGIRILNMSGFRDDSQSNAWDYSAFVRTYSLFLDERLECLSSSGSSRSRHGSRRSPRDDDKWSPRYDERRRSYDERRNSYDDNRRSPRRDERRYGSSGDYDQDQDKNWDRSGDRGGDRNGERNGDRNWDRNGDRSWDRNGDRSWDRNGDRNGDRNRDRNGDLNGDNETTALKDMNPEQLLDKLPKLQRLMERVLGCRPTGTARINRLIQIALYSVVGESFQLYSDLNDGIARLRDGVFEMEHSLAVKVFDIYKRAAKQFQELASFYGLCKDIGVGRSSEYPSVNRISPDVLDEIEDHLRDGRTAIVVRPKSPEPEPKPKSPSPERTYEDSLEMKALPAPPIVAEPEPEPEPEPTEADLLNLREDALTTEQEENKLALALFSSGTGSTGKWESFSPADRSDRPSMPATNYGEITGKAGWELALVESASNLAQAKGESLAGGFNPLLLESMYEQADANRSTASIPTGSESSVVSTGASRPSSNVLALPAPQSVAMPGQDPFMASAVVPPPPYVQMADVLKKQQLLAQEQQMWQQYQNEGMRGYYSMIGLQNQNAYLQPQPHLALPYYGMQRQFSYY